MNFPVRRAIKWGLYLVFLVALFQVTTTVTVIAQSPQSLTLEADAQNGPFSVGEDVDLTIDVGNVGGTMLTNVQLQLVPHPNILYVSGPGLSNPETIEATLNLGDLAPGATTQLVITTRIRGVTLRNGPMKVPVEVMASETDKIQAEAQIIVVQPPLEQRTIPAAGAQVQLANNRALMNFPSNWHSTSATLDFQILERRQLATQERGTFLAFEVEAVDSNGQEIIDFATPVTVTLQIDDLVDLTTVPSDTLYMQTREDDTQPWTDVPLTVDVTNGTIQFQATHFSEFKAGGDPPAPDPWELKYNPPGVSAFTGSANYSYPIPLPPERYGMTPNLAVSYSSRGADRTFFPVMASGFGVGWSMPQMEIVNGNAPDMLDKGLTAFCPNFSTNKFSLVLEGETFRLQLLDNTSSNDRHGRYIANGNPGLYIEYLTETSVNDNNITGEYWRVRTADGTTYQFGYHEESELVVGPIIGACGDPGGPNEHQPRNEGTFVAGKWKLDTITDKFGRELVHYKYATKCGEKRNWQYNLICHRVNTDYRVDESDPLNVDPSPQPAGNVFRREVDAAIWKIEYNFNSYNPSTNPKTVIEFDYLNYNHVLVERVDAEAYVYVGFFRPKEIFIKHDGTILSAHEFKYDLKIHELPGSVNSRFWWITEIIPKGKDPGNGSLPELPRYTFEYLKPGDNFSCDPDGTIDDCVYYLTQVENGYGAVTKLTYSRINNEGAIDGNGDWFIVTDISTYDGINNIYTGKGSPWTSQTSYEFHTDPQTGYYLACYDKGTYGQSGGECRTPYSEETWTLVGFEGVDIKVKDSTGITLSHQEKTFYTDNFHINGKPKSTIVYEPNSTPLQELSESSEVWETVQFTQFPYEVYFVKLAETKQITYHPNDDTIFYGTKTVYTYDQSNQGGSQWGQPTTVATYYVDENNADPDPNSAIPLQRQESRYISNTGGSNWLLVPYQQSLHEGNNSNPDQVQLFLYDGESDPDNQNITLGVLDWTLTLDIPETAPTGQNWNAVATKSEYFDVTSGLKNYLLRRTIDYSEYADIYVENNYTWGNVNKPLSTDWRNRTIVNYYPDALAIAWQKVRGRNITPDQQTNFTYDPDFYWLPKTITDPNGITQSFEFDDFGRLKYVKHPDPNDPQNDITEATYNYLVYDPDGAGPIDVLLEIETIAYPNEPDQDVKSKGFYNGLGQLVQQRTFDLNPSDGTASNWPHVWVDYEYDGLGRLICQTIPRPGSAQTYNPQDCVGSPTISTATEYDGLGRPIKTTSPSGATTYQQYPVSNGQLWKSTYDANQHAKRELYDELGRLAEVREIKGNCADYDIPAFYDDLECTTGQPPEIPWDDYAQTVYEYDVQGNLIKVNQDVLDEQTQTTVNIITTIKYDGLGRKTEMHDPDMGSWEYNYDAVGNLTSQIDLDSVGGAQDRLCLYYDSLNRLVRKVSNPSPGNSCPDLANAPISGDSHLATYEYGDTLPEIGKLIEVKWGPNPEENKDFFTYDSRGRLEKQERWIDNKYYVLETIEFDNLDKPTTVRYPDGEDVFIDYDRIGENTLAFGHSVPIPFITLLVSDTRYNSRNQLTHLDLYNGKNTEMLYHGANYDYRLERIQHGIAGDILPDFEYEYDPVGNITELTTQYLNAPPYDIQEFTYDHLDRLDSAQTTQESVASLAYNYTYEYDTLGNIDAKVDNGSSITFDYVYDYNDRPHAVRSINDGSTTSTFGYDNNGNMDTRQDESGDYDQFYDIENRLTSVVDNATADTTTFFYDADGQRVATIQPDGTTIHTPFPNFEKTYSSDSWNNMTVPEADFESDQQWSITTDSSFPGTGAGIGTPLEGPAHGSSQVLSMHNLASGYLESATLEAMAGRFYKVEGQIKGELFPATGIGNASVEIAFYDSQSVEITRTTIWEDDALQTNGTWQSISNLSGLLEEFVTAPSGTAEISILLATDRIDGWVAFDNFKLYEATELPPDWGEPLPLFDSSFEEGGSWPETKDPAYPATAIWHGDAGPFAANDGRYSLVIGNSSHSEISSSLFFMEHAGSPGHRISVWLKSETGVESNSVVADDYVYLTIHYYDGDSEWLGQETVWSTSEWYEDTWQQVSGLVDPIAGTVNAKIEIGNSLTTGSIYLDDVSAVYESGIIYVTHPVPNPSFELQQDWTLETNSTSSINWLTGEGNTGSHAYDLSNQNQANAVAQSATIGNINGDWTYEFKTWVRGEMAYGSGNLVLQLAFYDQGVYLTTKSVSLGISINNTWSQVGGQVSAPSDADEVRLEIFANQIDGWVLVDDVTLRELVGGDSVERSIYSLAGRPIAVRNVTLDSATGLPTSEDLVYVLTDHLGSHSAFTDENGFLVDIDGSGTSSYLDIIHYQPFGAFRGDARPDDVTNRSFTGHQDNGDIGLVYMNARYYVPEIGRFASADTIVPNNKDPQSFNRYSYTLNNPLRFIDPTGHNIETPEDDCIVDPNGGCDYQPYQELELPYYPSDPDDPRGSKLIGISCSSNGKCEVVEFPLPVYVARPGAVSGVAPRSEIGSKLFSLMSTTLDLEATAISGAYTTVQVAGAAFLGPTGPDDAVISAGYYIIDPIENLLSWEAAGMTMIADYLSGASDVDINSGELIVGQDTIFLTVTATGGHVVGLVPVAGPALDTTVNIAVNTYEIGRLAGIIPTYIEYRVGASGDYIVLYR